MSQTGTPPEVRAAVNHADVFAYMEQRRLVAEDVISWYTGPSEVAALEHRRELAELAIDAVVGGELREQPVRRALQDRAEALCNDGSIIFDNNLDRFNWHMRLYNEAGLHTVRAVTRRFIAD